MDKNPPSLRQLLAEMKKMQFHIRELEETGNLLKSREEMYREMVNSANSIILCWNTSQGITFINRFAQKFFGFSEKEIIGKSVIGTIVAREDAKGLDLIALMKEICRHPRKFVNNENENIKKNAERVWISWTNKPVYDRKGKFIEILSVGNDITRRKKAEDELERYATMDMMTGVLNRRAGVQFLEKSLHLSKRQNFKLTICFIDVNNLKMVNDNIGHAEGDELIRTVAGVLKESLRISDFACRLGGDEFLIVLPKCSLRHAKEQWKRIDERFSKLNSRKKKKYPVTVSHGFAEYQPGKPVPAVNTFITIADEEMYEDKKRQKAKLNAS